MRRIVLATAMCFAFVGCQQNAGPALMDTALRDELRAKVVLEDEPGEAITLHDLYDQLAALGEGVATDEDVIVVGRVGGLEDPDSPTDPRAKWTLGYAEFKIVDPATGDDADAEHDHGDAESEVGHETAEDTHADHDHSDPDHECPFCESEGPGIQTIVRFVDDDGILLPVDGRVLFKLNGEDIVVVRGKARLEPGNIVITGNGMHVRY